MMVRIAEAIDRAMPEVMTGLLFTPLALIWWPAQIMMALCFVGAFLSVACPPVPGKRKRGEV